MPVTTSARGSQPATPAAARLADVAGYICPAQPGDAGRRLAAGGFVWLDLQNPGPDQLQAFGQSLSLDEETLQALTVVGQRPSFISSGNSIRAVVPSVTPGRAAGDILGIRLLFTGRFLLTTHPGPCPALDAAYRFHEGLPDEKKADGPFVLFLILRQIVDTFEPDLVQLDGQLDAIQVALLGAPPAGVQQELIKIRRALSEAVQALGWYTGDLNQFISASQLPGMDTAAGPLFDHHRTRVAQLRDAARDYREEAQDALGQAAANISRRQGQLINVLAVVAAIFLPLTFITGYFGMNFDVLTMDLKTVWIYLLLGVLLPAASVIITLMLYRRLVVRMGVRPFLPAPPTLHAPRSEPVQPRTDPPNGSRAR